MIDPVRDPLTIQFENVPPANGLNVSTGSTSTQWPFYIDNNDHLNFCYGLDFTATGTAACEQIMTDSGVSSADITKINTYLAQNNSNLMTLNQLNAALTQQNWLPIAQSALDNYYSDPNYSSNVINNLTNQIYPAPISSLPIGVAAGLEDLLYNAPGAFSPSEIPNLSSDVSNTNWAATAADIEFNPNVADSSIGTIRRRIAEAAYVLGFSATYDSNHNVASLTPINSTSVNISNVLAYRKLVFTTNDYQDNVKWPTTFSGFINKYLASQGFAVASPAVTGGEAATDTWAALATLANQTNPVNIAAANLQALNAPFNGSIVDGSIALLPVSQTVLVSGGSTVSLPALGPNQAYAVDPASLTVYVIGADPSTSYANTIANLGLDSAGHTHVPVQVPAGDTFKAHATSGNIEIDGYSGSTQNFKETIQTSAVTNSSTLALGTSGIQTVLSAPGVTNDGNITIASGTSVTIDAPVTTDLPSDNVLFNYSSMTPVSSVNLTPGAVSTVASTAFSSNGLNFIGSGLTPTTWSATGSEVATPANSNLTSFHTTFETLYEVYYNLGYGFGAGINNTKLDFDGAFSALGLMVSGNVTSGTPTSTDTLTYNLGSGLAAGVPVFVVNPDNAPISYTVTASYQGNTVSTAGWTFDPESVFATSGAANTYSINAGAGTVSSSPTSGSVDPDVMIITPNAPVDKITITYKTNASAHVMLAAPIGGFDSYMTIGAGSTLTLANALPKEETVEFNSTGTANLFESSSADATIANMQVDDEIGVADGSFPDFAPWENTSNMNLVEQNDVNGVYSSNNGYFDFLYAGYKYYLSPSNNTLTVSNSYQNAIYATGTTNASATGGSGNDTFYVDDTTHGGTFNGGGGTNTLNISGTGNITGMTISNIQSLVIPDLLVTLTAAQIAPITSISTSYLGSIASPTQIDVTASGAGTFNLSGIAVPIGEELNLTGTTGTQVLTGVVNGTGPETITAGSGTDTIYSSEADFQQLYGGSGNDTFILSQPTGFTSSSVSYINGGSGTSVVQFNGGGTVNLGTVVHVAGFYLENAPQGSTQPAYIVSTGQLAPNLVIYGSAGNDTFYADDPTQTLNLGNGTDAIYAAAADAGTLIHGGTGQDSMYITSAGTATLNTSDTALYSVTLQSPGTTVTANGESGLIINDTTASGSSNQITLGGTDQVVNETAQNDTIVDLYAASGYAGSTINGGTGNNAFSTWDSDLSVLTFTNVKTIDANQSWVKVTASQFSSVTTFVNQNTNGTHVQIEAGSDGTYDLSSKTVTGLFDITLAGTSGVDEAIGSAAGEILTGGWGWDTFYATNGAEVMNGGTGTNNFNVAYETNSIAGTVINGVTGAVANIVHTWDGDLSVLTINNVSQLTAESGYTKLTNAEFSEFTTYTANVTGAILYVTNAGTYNLGTKTVNGSGTFNMDATYGTGNITLIGNSQAAQSLTGGTGTDVLTSGNGAGDIMTAGTGATTMNAGTGNDIFNAGTSGNDTLNGGAGTETYKFGSTFGQDVLNNIATGSRTTAAGAIDFGFASSYKDLWFKESGNNLVIDLLGTTDTVTVDNWFGSNAGAQTSSIVDTTDGYTMANSKVAALVTAMATYQTANPSFNPQTSGTTMPTSNTGIENALVAAWGHG